jgi:hypothetical protein
MMECKKKRFVKVLLTFPIAEWFEKSCVYTIIFIVNDYRKITDEIIINNITHVVLNLAL